MPVSVTRPILLLDVLAQNGQERAQGSSKGIIVSGLHGLGVEVLLWEARQT